jgi:hypothetical protein
MGDVDAVIGEGQLFGRAPYDAGAAGPGPGPR